MKTTRAAAVMALRVSKTLPVFLVLLLLVGATFLAGQASAYPASVSLFSHGNKLEEKPAANEDQTAEQSFQQFIHSAKPESSSSTLIGEIKPNSSELELMLLKNKIANTIQSMQEMEKLAAAKSYPFSHKVSGSSGGNGGSAGSGAPEAAECFIEVTRVERVAGRCSKVNNGLPICQADNYIAINTDCG